MVDFAKLAQQAAEKGKDLTKPTAGGSDIAPPAAGNCRLRFVGYVELGNHITTYNGQSKDKPRCLMIFEVSGPRHPAPTDKDGKPMPHLVTIRETVGFNEKNNYIKLFNMMNEGYGKSNFVGLLGNAYRGVIYHEPKDAKNPNPNEVYVRLRNDAGYSILSTTYTDEETGEPKVVQVAQPSTPIRCLLWDFADVEQWDTLRVPGENQWIQETIRKAANFKGSPIYAALAAAGRTADLEPPKAKEQNAQAPAAPVTPPAEPKAPSAGPAVVTPTKPLADEQDDVPW